MGWIEVSSLIVAVLLAAGVALILVVRRRRGGESGPTNYRAFFVMGIALLPVGAGMMAAYLALGIPFVVGLPIFALGLAYVAIGLENRDKW